MIKYFNKNIFYYKGFRLKRRKGGDCMNSFVKKIYTIVILQKHLYRFIVVQ